MFDLEYKNIFDSEINAKDILKIYKVYLFIEEKKIELEEYYSFLKYASYYFLYFYSLSVERGICDIEDGISVKKTYNEALETIRSYVEIERKKQGGRFLQVYLLSLYG